MSATGTAARVNLTYEPSQIRSCTQPFTIPMDKTQTDKDREKLYVDVNLANSAANYRIAHVFDSMDDGSPQFNCTLCHVPYKTESVPFPVNLSVCAICRKRKVPDVLFTTIDPPVEIQTFGKGSLIQARVCRTKVKAKGGETNAKEISDGLPFLEYELHSQLMNKLKLRGMNGLFGLKIQISVAETVILGVATATAVFFGALPAPPIPKVSGQATTEKESSELIELQKKITDTVQRNKEKHDLHNIDPGQGSPRSIATEDSEDDVSDMEVSFGNKEVFILEVDDANDQSIASILRDSILPDGFTLANTKKMPGQGPTTLSCNLQMFTHVWRGEFNPLSANKQTISDLFEILVKKICYKLRRMTPCCLCSIDFDIDLPEEDELQISLTGLCCGLDQIPENVSDGVFDPAVNKTNLLKMVSHMNSGQSDGEDMMFHMEELSQEGHVINQTSHIKQTAKIQKTECIKKSPHQTSKPRQWVEITPLSSIPGAKVERYLGNYNFFFIRETTSLREMGGLSGFIQAFIAEVLANVRANVSALGGNALVAYRMSHCVLLCNPHKNQSQCLINVSGDVVYAAVEGEHLPIIVDTVRKNSDSPLPGNVATVLQ